MRKIIKYLLIPSVFLLLAFLILPFKVSAGEEEKLATTDQVLVKYRSGIREEIKEKLRQRLDTVLSQRLERLDTEVVRVEKGTAQEKVRQFLRDPNVEYAEPDYIAYALELTSDPQLPKQWGMYKTQAAGVGESAWNHSKSNPDIKIAILDTGIDQNHEDLEDKVVANYNCTTTARVDDLYGHGTHVAGIAAAPVPIMALGWLAWATMLR